MPIEPPDPHDILPDLRAILVTLQRLAVERPSDARVIGTLGHVAAAVAILDATTPPAAGSVQNA